MSTQPLCHFALNKACLQNTNALNQTYSVVSFFSIRKSAKARRQSNHCPSSPPPLPPPPREGNLPKQEKLARGRSPAGKRREKAGRREAKRKREKRNNYLLSPFCIIPSLFQIFQLQNTANINTISLHSIISIDKPLLIYLKKHCQVR